MLKLFFIIDADFIINKVIESNEKRGVTTAKTEGEYSSIKKDFLQEIEEWRINQVRVRIL